MAQQIIKETQSHVFSQYYWVKCQEMAENAAQWLSLRPSQDSDLGSSTISVDALTTEPLDLAEEKGENS